MKSRWPRRLLGAALVAATLWYLTHAVAGQWGQLRSFRWELDPWRLTLSTLVHVAVLGWGVCVWSRALLCFEHAPVSLWPLQRIWFLSNLARYVPGKVFQFVAVAQLSRAAGLSGPVLLTSMLVHTGMSLLAAGVVAAWTLAHSLVSEGWVLTAQIAATAAALLLVHPAFLNAALGAIPRLLGRTVIRWNGRWLDGIRLVALSVLSWLWYGGAYYLFLSSLAPIPRNLFAQLTGVNALSFLAGYVSPLPGGAGLREIAMSELLESYLASGVAAVLAVASRLWTIAAELIGGAAVLWVARGNVHCGGVPNALEPFTLEKKTDVGRAEAETGR